MNCSKNFKIVDTSCFHMLLCCPFWNSTSRECNVHEKWINKMIATINSWFRPLSLWANTQILVKLHYFNNFKVEMNQTSSKPPPKTGVVIYLDLANPNNRLFKGKSFKTTLHLHEFSSPSQPPVFMVQNFPTSTLTKTVLLGHPGS